MGRTGFINALIREFLGPQGKGKAKRASPSRSRQESILRGEINIADLDAGPTTGPRERRSGNYRTPEIIRRLYLRQDGECRGCGNGYLQKDMQVDHVVPLARGGSDDLSNLQLLCAHCNTTKGTGTMEDLFRRLNS